MTTIPMSSSTEVAVVVGPLFSDAERAALAGFLAGYSGQTRDAYTLDLRQYTSWCARQGLRLFTAKRADVECYARDLEARGRARATIARRLCTVAGFYRYAVEEDLLDHSPAGHVRRPRLDYESHAVGLDRNEVGGLLVAAGLRTATEHALISLLAINGLRVSEALGADTDDLSIERGHRTLTILRKGGKLVTIPLAPRTARAIEATAAIIARWADAWEAGDVDAIVAMLAEDARYSMPPLPEWYRGTEQIRVFLVGGPLQSRWRFLPTTANGQLAFGTYLWDDDTQQFVPGGLDVLTIRDGRVEEIVAFLTADLTRFGLPPIVEITRCRYRTSSSAVTSGWHHTAAPSARLEHHDPAPRHSTKAAWTVEVAVTLRHLVTPASDNPEPHISARLRHPDRRTCEAPIRRSRTRRASKSPRRYWMKIQSSV